ncbi:hypothetical protein ID866_8718 [Astraeus odoratus]|nr:hypothetical protein ID866_8718 [Astraeus odoratus]
MTTLDTLSMDFLTF